MTAWWAFATMVLGGIGAPLEAVNQLVNRIREEHYAGIASIGQPETREAVKLNTAHKTNEGEW